MTACVQVFCMSMYVCVRVFVCVFMQTKTKSRLIAIIAPSQFLGADLCHRSFFTRLSIHRVCYLEDYFTIYQRTAIPGPGGYFHMYAYWVCATRETPIFSPEFPFRSISFSQITKKSVLQHHYFTFFGGFCRSGDHHFQNFFNFTLPRHMPTKIWGEYPPPPPPPPGLLFIIKKRGRYSYCNTDSSSELQPCVGLWREDISLIVIQLNLIIKRLDKTKPSYNKVIVLVPAL